MKYLLSILSLSLLLSCGTDINDNDLDTYDHLLEFELAPNGVSIKCTDANPGDIGVVDGAKYEAVNNDLLRQRIDGGSDLSKLCVSLVTDMSGLFYDNRDFNQPIGNWDVSNVKDMSQMFFGFSTRTYSFNQPIGEWDVSSVTDMSEMFKGSPFNQPIGDWDVSSVTSMRVMFYENLVFNQPLGNWDVSSVTNMNQMFWHSDFHQPIGNWDVSNVTDMTGMFRDTRFNYDISGWCVWRFETEPEGFSHNSPLTPQNKPVWGTCPD